MRSCGPSVHFTGPPLSPTSFFSPSVTFTAQDSFFFFFSRGGTCSWELQLIAQGEASVGKNTPSDPIRSIRKEISFFHFIHYSECRPCARRFGSRLPGWGQSISTAHVCSINVPRFRLYGRPAGRLPGSGKHGGIDRIGSDRSKEVVSVHPYLK